MECITENQTGPQRSTLQREMYPPQLAWSTIEGAETGKVGQGDLRSIFKVKLRNLWLILQVLVAEERFKGGGGWFDEVCVFRE